jgi:hypothetical protein
MLTNEGVCTCAPRSYTNEGVQLTGSANLKLPEKRERLVRVRWGDESVQHVLMEDTWRKLLTRYMNGVSGERAVSRLGGAAAVASLPLPMPAGVREVATAVFAAQVLSGIYSLSSIPPSCTLLTAVQEEWDYKKGKNKVPCTLGVLEKLRTLRMACSGGAAVEVRYSLYSLWYVSMGEIPCYGGAPSRLRCYSRHC